MSGSSARSARRIRLSSHSNTLAITLPDPLPPCAQLDRSTRHLGLMSQQQPGYQHGKASPGPGAELRDTHLQLLTQPLMQQARAQAQSVGLGSCFPRVLPQPSFRSSDLDLWLSEEMCGNEVFLARPGVGCQRCLVNRNLRPRQRGCRRLRAWLIAPGKYRCALPATPTSRVLLPPHSSLTERSQLSSSMDW